MGDFARRVEALRQPLLAAARDGFAGLAEARGLGGALRRACERVVAAAPEEEAGAFADYGRRLEAFDRLERDLQQVEVARGLRLCQTVAGRAPRPARRPRAVPTREVSPLEAPVESLPGIGPTLAARLEERGLATVEDLLLWVPRRYDDVRNLAPLARALVEAAPGERISVVAVVDSCRFVRRGPRRWLDLRVRDASETRARLTVRWFNAHGGMARRFPPGAEVALSGLLKERGGALEMANPDLLAVAAPGEERQQSGPTIIPRYPEVPGVAPGILRRACAAAVERAAAVSERVEPAPRDLAPELPALCEALRVLHAPPEDLLPEELASLGRGDSRWHRRLAWDELFLLGLAVARRRRERRADVAVPCPAPPEPAAAVERALPFSLTGAQRRAIDAIAADLSRPVPMNRLLQGDVGSGKTAVLFAAAHQAAAAGRQAALMAPTEILAEQHFAGLEGPCRALGMRPALLTASTPKGARASILSLLAGGEIDLVVGTHALLSEGVAFAALGLAIVDEQHRFGVAQRAGLRGKGNGEGAPHLLVTTATPIPRTLALTAYGDLDVTVLDELPPGRTPPATRVLTGAGGRRAASDLLRARALAGERGYVVCPLVEPAEGEAADAGREGADATTTAARLARELAPARVGLVHGRMARGEREEAMERFRSGALDVLCATTVIEVGVDVPEATVMIVEDADRFGLSQLHQLRGRVGRGGGASHCLLLCRGGMTDAGYRRLAVMAETSDGFRIAEEDLRIRGPGELLGARQAGLPRLRFADLAAHVELLVAARDAAERLLAGDPDLEHHPATRDALARRIADGEAYGAEGG